MDWVVQVVSSPLLRFCVSCGEEGGEDDDWTEGGKGTVREMDYRAKECWVVSSVLSWSARKWAAASCYRCYYCCCYHVEYSFKHPRETTVTDGLVG